MPIGETSPAWRARAHRTALNFNWDYGCKKLFELIRRQCDLGTALLVYWRGSPNWYRQFPSRNDVKPPRDTFDLLVEIEEKVLAGFYPHRNLSFDPFNDKGYDRTKAHSSLRHKFCCELPEVMYAPVGEHAPSIQRRPFTSGKEGLPVGLSAIAKMGRKEPLGEREKAIEALNELNDHSCKEVVEQKGDYVFCVDLGSNYKATDEALENLQWFPELEELTLGQIMTDKALAYLKLVPRLRVLDLSCTKFTSDGMAQLRQLPELEELNLHGCRNITDAGMVHVKELNRLKKLHLGSTKIGNEGIANLEALHDLEYLDLFWYTKITNPGLKHLANLKKLRWLRISKTKIGDAGLLHLCSLKCLKRLAVGETKVTEKGVENLRKALPECEIVSEVY